MSSPVLEARQLTFRYEPHLDPVLDGVDLEIEAGEFVALLGQNGAGKTTLAKHFNGLLLPSGGDVLVDGESTRDQPLDRLARRVGYCYQNPDHQIFSATVEREVRFGPENLGLRGDELHAAVDAALELVGLQAHRDAHPFSLGRGQRQLLAVGSVLAMGPPILVIDEPTTGMDYRGAARIMELLATWNARGRTIVVITHDMDMVAEYVPRSVVVSDGRILGDGPTLDLFAEAELLALARLEVPAPVRMSRALQPLGVPRCGSVPALVDAITTLAEVQRAGRL